MSVCVCVSVCVSATTTTMLIKSHGRLQAAARAVCQSPDFVQTK